jgi:HSP20 family protein
MLQSPNTRPILLLLLAALLLATASSTAAMQLFPMASHPEVDACVDAEADERRLLQHDHCDRGGVSTCGVDDPVTTRHPAVRARWPAVVDALRRSVRDTTARAREGLRRARLRHRAAARASSEETPPGDDDDDDDEGAHHAAQRDTLAAIVDTLEDIERQLFLAAPSRRAASRAPAPLAALRDRALSWLGRGPDKTDGAPLDSATTNHGLVDWQRDLLFKTAVDVVETDRAYVLRADVPGLGDEDLRVDVDDDARTLRVFGRRDDAEDTNANANAKTKTKTKPKTKNAAAADDEDRSEHPASGPALTTPVYHARERHFGAFENTYALPPDADALAVVAAVRGGVLEVTVPKRLAEAGAGTRGPRRVAVARE